MDKVKYKYEVFLGFVTIIISLSAFKSELSKLNIDLGFMSITLAEYFLYAIIGFLISLYLFVFEIIIRDTKIGRWKIFGYIQKTAYVLFSLIIISPILILLYVATYQLGLLLQVKQVYLTYLLNFLRVLLVVATIFYYWTVAKNYLLEKKLEVQNQANKMAIRNLNEAIKLNKEGYYSYSILKCYEILENYLHKMITSRNLRVSKFRFDDLIEISFKEGIIDKNDFEKIESLSYMRNISAHIDQNETKEQAENFLLFIKELIRK